MRAILVCVDYGDLLAVTLPWNRHYFSEVMVVTSDSDVETQKVARDNGAICYCTDAFWRSGADLNKWLALEEGLDRFGRRGWMCVMDADVLWPKNAHVGEIIKGTLSLGICKGTIVHDFVIQPGYLAVPRRRMMPVPTPDKLRVATGEGGEGTWTKWRLNMEPEFAGYSQIFHADDPVLPPPPWHQTNWRHAGGADSFFQRLWPDERKVRPPFEVLHIGDAGQNWCGRATPRLDGSVPPGAALKQAKLLGYRAGRRRRAGDPYAGEKF